MTRARLKRIGDLEIDQHLSIQAFSWRLQQIGQVLMVLFIGAALLGYFGSGPKSRTTVGDPSRLSVEYDRFERRTQESALIVRLGPQPTGRASLWFDERYVAAQPFLGVLPEPEGVEILEGRLVVTLRVSGARSTIRIVTKPEAIGSLRGRMGILGGPEVAFTQFVYP
jgi:hypothetical protein